jgi:branched-chain amino acid transport system permease protein
MAILGGTEDVRGPIIGAVALTLIAERFGIEYPYHYMALLGITLILLIKFLPMGLLSAIGKISLRRKLS